MNKILLFLSFPFFLQFSLAQNYARVIKGNVIDSISGEPIKDVTITLFKATDTSLINFAFTTPIGNFELTTKLKDSLILVVSLVGYKEFWKKIPASDGGWWWWNNEKVKLVRFSNEMKEARVYGSAIRMKGDTIEISASRFKVMPGSDVSQLFAKIPGFKIDVKGNLTVDGNKVSKIMVDGSDFFGNNPGLVSKNLKADMVQTVQVYEDKDIDGVPLSDQTKTINLKLKPGKRTGVFGDVLAGYGTDNRYESGLRINSFKYDRKFSFIYNSNNTNGTGFDFGFKNWHGDNNMFRNGSGNSDNYYYNRSFANSMKEEGNINQKNDVALTYFNEFKKKRKLSFDIGINSNKFNSIDKSVSENLINESTFQKYESNSIAAGNYLIYYLSGDYTRKIDSTGDVSFSVSLGQATIKNKNTENSVVSSSELLISDGLNYIDATQVRNHIESMYKFSKRAKKSKYLRWNIELMMVNDFEKNTNYQYTLQNRDTINFKNNKNINMTEIHAKTGFKIPLYKDKLQYTISSDLFTKGSLNNQAARNAYNPIIKNFSQEYSSPIDSLTIDFNNGVIQASLVNGLILRNKNFQMSAGVTYLSFLLENSIVQGPLIKKNYNRYLPYFNFSTWHKKIGYLSASAEKSVDFPDANSLFPIPNLSSPFYRVIGNTELKPENNSVFRLGFYKRKFKLLDLISIWTSFSITNNYITQAKDIKTDGITYLQPINLDGFTRYSIYSNFEKLIKEKLNISFMYQYYGQQSPQIINGEKGLSKSQTHNLSPSIEYTINDKFDVEFSYTLGLTYGKNDLNNVLNFEQTTQIYSLNLRGVFWGKTEVSISGNLNDQRQVPGIGKVIPLVNSYIQQSFDKAKKYNLKLTCFDIFKQNVSISRDAINGGYIISESNQLQQYFMLTLVRKLNKTSDDDDAAAPTY